MPLPVWVKEEIYEYEHLCDLLLTARILLYLYSIKGARAERSGCQCSGEIIPNTTSIKWDRIAGGDKSRDEYVFPSFIPSPPPSSMLPTCVLGAHVRCVYKHPVRFVVLSCMFGNVTLLSYPFFSSTSPLHPPHLASEDLIAAVHCMVYRSASSEAEAPARMRSSRVVLTATWIMTATDTITRMNPA